MQGKKGFLDILTKYKSGAYMILREDDERPCPPVVRDVLVGKDGWELYDESKKSEDQPPFNLYWKTNRFFPSQIQSCQYPYQRCNHYPKSSEITKKDGLYRHMKRMRVTHGASLFGFVPETFTLPNEYVKFCQYFADERDKAMTAAAATGQSPTSSSPPYRPPLYICKPAELSRGRKIFVFDDIGELTYDCSSVVQRYVERPLLIFGHKVDFRIYVLVTSFQPLRMYMYDNFLTRFGGEPFTMDNKDTFVHLTNYSVSKTSTSSALRLAGVGETCKWDGPKTRDYFASCGVDFSLLWSRIATVVRCTVLSICHLVPSKPQCFELYGFDVLFDDQLQPWLIEANFSPALAVESEVDTRVKHGLMHDMIATLNIQPHPDPNADRPPSGAAATDGSASPAALSNPAGDAARAQGTSTAVRRAGPPLARSRSSSRVLAPGPGPGAPTSRGVPVRARASLTARSNSSSAIAPRVPSQSKLTAGASSTGSHAATVLIDRPHGGMKQLFPFNTETEALSQQALQPGMFDVSLKGMLQEVRKADAKAVQQLKPLAAVYAERSSTAKRMSRVE